MRFMICFSISIIILLMVFVAITIEKRFIVNRVKPVYVFAAGIFLAAFFMFFPVCDTTVTEGDEIGIHTFLYSVHHAMQLFVMGSDFSSVIEATRDIGYLSRILFRLLAAVLYVLAPIATFTVAISFVKNAAESIRILIRRARPAYVFSSCSLGTLALVKSMKAEGRKGFYLVTGLDEAESTQIENKLQAEGCFVTDADILSLTYLWRQKNRPVTIYLNGSEDENIRLALSFIEKYGHLESKNLYVSAVSDESEMILNANVPEKMKVRRVNYIRTTILQDMYEKGTRLFDEARSADSNEKTIRALILGFGSFGTEMLKALTWMCQMDGYKVYIDAFDRDYKAIDDFRCCHRELLDENHNNVRQTGEAEYSINLHEGIDVRGTEFNEYAMKEAVPTYIFVALGNDKDNTELALMMRRIYLSRGYFPWIQAVVFDSDKRKALSEATNYKNEPYDIDFMGDFDSVWSVKNVEGNELEAKGLERHLKWGDEESFWKYDYNYRSSVASAIHRKLKLYCGISGMDKVPEDRKPEDRDAIRVLEHKRWNAYMRTEGYSYDEKRNDIARTHHCLVPFDDLPEKEKIKDDD